MNSLAALFTLIGLGLYFWGRIRLFSGQGVGMLAILVGVFIFTPLAILCKENGALLPFFMLVAELTLFRFETAQPVARRFLIALFLICAVLPVLVFISYIAMNPGWLLGGYSGRDFNLPERLMTEARVVWFYLRLIVMPSNAAMGIFHDDIVISHGVFDPLITLAAIIGIIALPVIAAVFLRRQPLVTFGLLFFLIGHSMESTIIPLELVHEHRNYLPMYGILLAFFHLLLQPFHKASARIPRRVLVVLLIALFGVDTYSRAAAWSNPYELWHTEIEHHPKSPRTNIEMGSLYANLITPDPLAMGNNYLLARQYYEHANNLQKSNVNGLFGLIQLNTARGLPVERGWLTELAYRLEHETVPANVNDQLVALVACRMQKNCSLSAQDIELLLRAPLRNPRIFGSNKALVHTALTYYLINVAQDYPAAIESINQSIALAPQELEYRLTLVRFLIALERPNDARKQLALLKRIDKRHSRDGDIAMLEEQLSAMK